MKKKLKINVGTKFGKWEIISNTTQTKNNITHWLCKCECGETEEYIPLNNLMNDTSTQCVKCARKNVGMKKRRGIGNISGQMWGRYKKKYGDDLKLKINEAWGLYELQDRRCPLTDEDIIICGYPYDTKKTTAVLLKIEPDKPLDKANSIWVHKSITDILNNKTISELFNIINKINNNIDEEYKFLLK